MAEPQQNGVQRWPSGWQDHFWFKCRTLDDLKITKASAS